MSSDFWPVRLTIKQDESQHESANQRPLFPSFVSTAAPRGVVMSSDRESRDTVDQSKPTLGDQTCRQTDRGIEEILCVTCAQLEMPVSSYGQGAVYQAQRRVGMETALCVRNKYIFFLQDKSPPPSCNIKYRFILP